MKAMYYICNICTVAKRGEEYTNVIITSLLVQGASRVNSYKQINL